MYIHIHMYMHIIWNIVYILSWVLRIVAPQAKGIPRLNKIPWYPGMCNITRRYTLYLKWSPQLNDYDCVVCVEGRMWVSNVCCVIFLLKLLQKWWSSNNLYLFTCLYSMCCIFYIQCFVVLILHFAWDNGRCIDNHCRIERTVGPIKCSGSGSSIQWMRTTWRFQSKVTNTIGTTHSVFSLFYKSEGRLCFDGDATTYKRKSPPVSFMCKHQLWTTVLCCV